MMKRHSPEGLRARAPQDIAGGLVLMLLALLALYLARSLPATGSVGFASGTAPRIFAYALLFLGGIITLGGWLREGPRFGAFSLRGPATILGSILVFAAGIGTFGLAMTGVPMVMLASAAADDFNWREAGIFAFCITAFCALLFPMALGQPIPLWPRF